ncbi:MAG: DUF4325 domain-containing protein [Gammaproteobacteria bacterium]|nr:MAG: DUF4325 domain-containing protein [Gammaproteobacteria bacterium]
MQTINIGQCFSLDPSGRFYSDDSGASGEQFREEHLLPALQNLQPGEKIIVILDDGPESYGSSFLTEGFAGIVKYGYMEARPLLDALEIEYTDPDYEFFEKKIKKYISEAKFASKDYKSTK